jgi:hypothetical protein
MDNAMQLDHRKREQSREGDPMGFIGLFEDRSVHLVELCNSIRLQLLATEDAMSNSQSAAMLAAHMYNLQFD